MIGRLRKWARDTRGVAAIEFAFIAPILILLYFGMVEFCQGYMALKRTGHTASMVADIVSRTSAINKQQAEDVLDIGDLIIGPFPTANLRQRVGSVTRVNATTYRVDWSVGVGEDMTTKMTVADAKIPSDLLAVGETAIVAEAKYDYKSPFSNMLPSTIRTATTFERMSYLRPRSVNFIPCADC